MCFLLSHTMGNSQGKARLAGALVYSIGTGLLVTGYQNSDADKRGEPAELASLLARTS